MGDQTPQPEPEPTPEPTPVSTPVPTTITYYTLTVRYYDPNDTGCNPTLKTDTYQVTRDKRVYISTRLDFCWTSGWSGGLRYFSSWEGDSGGIVQNRGTAQTEVYCFTSNGTLTATYR